MKIGPYRRNFILHYENSGDEKAVENAIKYVKENKFTVEEVKIVRRTDETLVVTKKDVYMEQKN